MSQKNKRSTLILGVTGHRYISSHDASLVKQVSDKLDDIRVAHGNARIVVLSGLAEGADRLVAHVAIKHLQAKLVPVLPVPPEEYAKDFRDVVSRREFDGLISRSEAVVNAPLLTKDAWREHGDKRNEQYAWIGAFIARFSNILFALWDGQASNGKGGTADVVQWFRQGSAPETYDIEQEKLAVSAGLSPTPDIDLRKFLHLKVTR